MSRSPYLHALELLAASRNGTPPRENIEIGETAQGRPYVKSVTVYLRDDEGWGLMCDRALGMFSYLRDNLPQAAVSPQGTPGALDDTAVAPKARRRAAVTA